MMAQTETPSRFKIRLDAARRLFMWHILSGRRPFYLVSEYPKCGGSWVSQMLSAYLDIPFPRNEDVSLVSQPPSLLHDHRLYSRRFHNAVYVLRDGRDVMVSGYYHSLIYNNKNTKWAVDLVRSEMNFRDYDNIEDNLPAFIDYEFTVYPRGFFHFSWSEYVDSVLDNSANVVKYEDLLKDPSGTLANVIKKLTDREPDTERIRRICEQYSFDRQAKRKPGEEDTTSFLRKGIAGDWKNKFSLKACEVFDNYAGDALIKAGYEKDRSWIEESRD